MPEELSLMRVVRLPLVSLILTYCAMAHAAVDSQTINQIDATANEWLVSTGAPSAPSMA